jgi:membrane protease YdiL (CAAX protease family)
VSDPDPNTDVNLEGRTPSPASDPLAAESPVRDVDAGDDVFWGWHDFFLFFFITVVALGMAMLAGAGIRHLFHLSEARMNIVLVISQFAAYGVSFTCLKLMFRAEYGEPLLKSLQWKPSPIMPGTLALVGLGQAFAIALFGSLLSVPQTENPMTRLMSDRPTSFVVAALGVTAAPLAEELAFRGLLQPLMIRLMGAIPGILSTGILFGFMHLEQYGSWQSVLLVGLAGVGFGVMRHLTGSTQASTIMHAGYNSALFIVFFSQKGPPH